MHHRCLFSSFHRYFKYISCLDEGRYYVLPPDILDEILVSILLLPFAETSLRADVSNTILATDSTVEQGLPGNRAV